MKKHHYEKAIGFYTEAIKLNPSEAIYLSNRSAAYYNMDKFEKALEDANNALELNRDFVKAFYRKIACLYELDRFDEAKKTIEESLQFGEYEGIQAIAKKIEDEIIKVIISKNTNLCYFL